MENNRWIEDWLSSRCESPKTVSSYKPYFKMFGDFCRERGRDLFSIVEQWRAAKDRERLRKKSSLKTGMI